MVASATPRSDRQCQPTGAAWHGIRGMAKRVAILLALVAFATFVTAGTSQACLDKSNSPQLAAQIDTHPSATVHNPAPKIAQLSSVALWNIGFARGLCCGNSQGHCHSPAGAGSCCSACMAAVIAAGCSITRNPTLNLVVTPLQACLSSIEFGGQFRPPRNTL
jgi:hypothetical protein